jgi:FkbH-like protein
MNTIAFIDDQTFELEEVNHSHKEVVCIDASELGNLLEMPIMSPRFITNESKMRRHMYQSDIERNHAEEEYKGANDTFLETLEMEFSISNASEDDLQRAEELTERTNQLNSTGYTYSYDELNNFRISEKHKLLTSKLNDKYGTYGTIGLALVECTDDAWVVKLLLMSCRVMSRGVGTIMMNHIMNEAKNNNARLLAEFVQTDRNRLMYITYKFAGFKEIVQKDNIIVFEGDLSRIQPNPEYVKISIDAS